MRAPISSNPFFTSARVLRGERPRAADARELAAIDLLPDADDVGLEAGVVERVVDVLGAGAVGAVGAVGEDHQRAEPQRHRRALHLLGQQAHPLDDGAVQVGRRVARPLRRQRGDAAADVAAERRRPASGAGCRRRCRRRPSGRAPRARRTTRPPRSASACRPNRPRCRSCRRAAACSGSPPPRAAGWSACSRGSRPAACPRRS